MSNIKHIGMIMDGNGRWAKLRGRPRTFGHIKGARVAKKIITECSRLKVQSLTMYAFSTENWLRPQSEVGFLMELLRRYLNRETENLVRENIRFTVIGDLKRLPLDLLKLIDHAIDRTSTCTGLNLVFAISYGSRNEITEAVRQIAARVQAGDLRVEDIEEHTLSAHLMTSPESDPDLIIRTSGESRLSNFLLWQSAYAELAFTDVLWPDFTTKDLHEILHNFSRRERRFGTILVNEDTPN